MTRKEEELLMSQVSKTNLLATDTHLIVKDMATGLYGDEKSEQKGLFHRVNQIEKRQLLIGLCCATAVIVGKEGVVKVAEIVASML